MSRRRLLCYGLQHPANNVYNIDTWLFTPTDLDRSRPAKALSLVVVIDHADVTNRKLPMWRVLEAERALVGLKGAPEATGVAAVGVDELPAGGRVVTHLADWTDGVAVDDGAAARTGPE